MKAFAMFNFVSLSLFKHTVGKERDQVSKSFR